MTLPDQYKWILNEPGPKMLLTALKYYGLKEAPGSSDNPTIMQWAHDFGITWYEHDSIAWCSLFMGQVAKESGYNPPGKDVLLAAVSWATWGNKAFGGPELGDILVFNRPGGHHVGLYIGEDDAAYHVLGGNTGDAVAIARIAKDRLMAVRYPAEEAQVPTNSRKIFLSASGELSQNEA